MIAELGGGSYPARAVIAQGSERDRLYGLNSTQVPGFREYEQNTDRSLAC
ncbi:MAG: hypothetical protein ACR2MP_03945 [Streptosporangiaceae bacterium]